MRPLKQEIFRYVDNKRGSWTDTTLSTAYSKLCTIDSIGWDDPAKVYKELSSQGYSNYTIQTYFWIAKDFEEQVKKTRSFHKWLKDNRLRFKNCYKEKTKRLTKPEFEVLLGNAPVDLYNFLVLLGKFGLRKSEAFNACWEDFQDGRFCIRSGKGNKQRFLPRQWSQWLSVQNKEGFIVPRSLNFSEFIKPFTPHDFRHYAVTSWVTDDKLNLKQAAVLAGHASILTTARYIKADLSEIEEKLR